MEIDWEGDGPGLAEGTPVVHVNHGVALFRGLETIHAPAGQAPDGAGTAAPAPPAREYLILEYRGGDKLYVPADQIDRVLPYVGPAAAGDTLALDRLGGPGWAKSVAAARREAAAVAEEMLRRYAARTARRRPPCGPDTPEQRAVEAAFPHDETPDQLAAVAAVKSDLAAPHPMDRLLVGDVGYGKTEVAVRAAFKVAAEGRQVAVLCPTSVLAAQHFQTFTDRLAGHGVRLALLSRTATAEEQAAALQGLRDGAVDIAVGTHRLLSEDVAFKNLGLVVVDEEQRFGVTHKERLKALRETVDVLTMTATPIPRTLSLAASGLLDVSVIADPPKGRAPIETAVHEYDDALVADALRRELARDGQAYHLHNRVEDIREVADGLSALVPAARVRVAHGQMPEDELEAAMDAFYRREADVLVCTTIVETGLDVPNANTIIVDAADRLGLAQLYQLRGRVGRSERQAYALLLFRRPDALTAEAAGRLDALRRFTAPGSGHRIAQRDLELRGAGSLLGLEQSGASAAGAVGFDLFLRLLDREVSARHAAAKPDPRSAPLPAVDLPALEARIPAEYVAGPAERLALYAAAARARSDADVETVRERAAERYGTPPPPAEGLFALTRLRLRCRAGGVEAVTAEAGGTHLTLRLRKGARPAPKRLAALREAFDARTDAAFTVEPDHATVHVGSPAEGPSAVGEVADALAAAARRPAERHSDAEAK